MSLLIHIETDLRSSLLKHREAFETLAEHDDGEIAELLGEFPLELIDELPDREDDDE
ncbi:hypothetical protein [Halocatena marina]|uniref:hypothetical protein n=1 Tax=Halocatena marina TaxID=2934937 RepID=UPI00200EB49C|nr:hypothetical protein [Halocatena marina]